jgi:LacI family transcriptional regulator
MNRKAAITIYDIADALALSPSTVSRALSGNTLIHKDTRNRILEKARDLGYRQNFFATRLRTQRTNVIGALVPLLNNGFVSNVISGAEVMLRLAGYNLIVRQSMNSRDFFVSSLENFNRSRVDGILIINSCIPGVGLPEYLTANIHAPAIVIQDAWRLTPSARKETGLIIKNSYDLTDRLIKQGCKRILYVASARNKANSDVFNGYQQALRANNVPDTAVPEAVIFDSEESAVNICRRLMSVKTRPDGILLCTDIISALSFPAHGNSISYPAGDNLLWLSNDQGNFPSSGKGFLELGKLATKMLIGLVDNIHGE